MKQILNCFFSLVFLFPPCMHAQPGIVWEKSWGGTYSDFGVKVLSTSDGNFLLLGSPNSINGDMSDSHGQGDIWVSKIDPTGHLIWQKMFGGSNNDKATGVVHATDGGYLIIGSVESYDGDITNYYGESDIWLVKINENGDLLWQKSYGGSSYESSGSILPLQDGGYVITCTSTSEDYDLPPDPFGLQDIWAFKITAAGDMVWSKRYGGNNDDFAGSAIATSDNGLIILGGSFSTNIPGLVNNGYCDNLVIKTDSSGVIQWKRMVGGNGSDFGGFIQPSNDGGYLIMGLASSNSGMFVLNHGGFDIWVYKLNVNGVVIWNKLYGGSSLEEAGGFSKTADGNYVFVGHTLSQNGDLAGVGYRNAWIVSIKPNGAINWKMAFGGTNDDEFSDVVELSNGEYLAIGQSTSNDGDVQSGGGPTHAGDIWAVRLGMATAVDDVSSSNPDWDIAPNPSHDYLEIIGVDAEATGVITIYDLQGKMQYRQTLSHGLPINLSTLSPGAYMLSMEDKEIRGRKIFIKD